MAGMLAQTLDLRLGQHGADSSRQAKAALECFGLVGNGRRIGRVAGIDLGRHRASFSVAQNAVDDDRLARLAVTAVAERRERVVAAFVITSRGRLQRRASGG